MGVITGFTDLDLMFEHGFQKGCLYVLAGRPSMGKTSLAINMLDYICFGQYQTVLYFSLEMSKKQMIERILSLKSEINLRRIHTGEIYDEDWLQLAKATEAMSKSKIVIDDTLDISIKDIRSRCLECQNNSEGELSAVFIDYLQLISSSDNNQMSRSKENSEVIRLLKDIARELDCPIVILSNICRKPDYRYDHRPTLDDLCEKSIIQFADVIMLLYRDEYYYNTSKQKGIAEVIVAQNKTGTTGIVELEYQTNCMRFANKKG